MIARNDTMKRGGALFQRTSVVCKACIKQCGMACHCLAQCVGSLFQNCRMTIGNGVEGRCTDVNGILDIARACSKRIGMTADNGGNAFRFAFQRSSQNITAFGKLACKGIGLFAKNIADAFADRCQIFADLCLGFVDHRTQRRATAGEGLCDFTSTSDEVFVDLARTGFESCIELFSAAVESMRTGFELGQKRPATLGKGAFEVGKTGVEFADHGLRCTAKKIGNTGRAFVQSFRQAVRYSARLFIKRCNAGIDQVCKSFARSRDAGADVTGASFNGLGNSAAAFIDAADQAFTGFAE